MNFNKNKITLQGKMRGLLMVLFFVGGFLFYQAQSVHAADSNCLCYTGGTANMNSGGLAAFKKSGDPFNATDVDGCQKMCGINKANAYCFNADILKFVSGCVVTDNVLTSTSIAGNGSTFKTVVTNSDPSATITVNGQYNGSEKVQDVCSAGGAALKGDLGEAFKCILYSVFQGMGWLLGLVATLFQWVVEPSNISGGAGLLNQPTVKDVWIMVRDTLNMVFILVLLFSAFCTVFQVEKWSLKKVWLSILINALLVNFSFPIARFFIDVSNVAMYYFLNNLFTGTGQGSGKALISSFSEQSKISTILTPTAYASATTTYMLAGIVFTFILGMTLLVLAVLFVIRLIALTMLLMFSPIGFVGNIFPEMNKFASDWWSNLFKHAFFGPVMVFMMMVAIAIMKATPDTFTQAATGNVGLGGVDANWIGSAAFFSIPIIILWTAMGISQKMGVAGADKIVGAAKKWGGSIARSPWTGIKTISKASGATGGVKKGWENARKSGKLFGKDVKFLKDGREDRETRIAGYVGNRKDGVEAANRNIHAKHVAEKEKEMEDMRTNSSELKKIIDPANFGKHGKAEIEAAARILSKREAFSGAGELQNALGAMDHVYGAGSDQSQEKKTELLKKADKNIFTSATELTAALGHLGDDFKNINQIIDKMEGQAFDSMTLAQHHSITSADPTGNVRKALDKRLRKEGKSNVLVDVALSENGTLSRQAAVREVLNKIKTEDVAKQEMFRAGATNNAEANVYVNNLAVTNKAKYEKIKADMP